MRMRRENVAMRERLTALNIALEKTESRLREAEKRARGAQRKLSEVEKKQRGRVGSGAWKRRPPSPRRDQR